jgi:cytochrome c oxidase subunit 3
LIQANRSGTVLGLIITIILALVFTALQGLEYFESSFTISDGAFGSTFYFSTGFHSFHVMIGTAMLTVAFIRILSNQLTTFHHLGFESSILY